MKKPKGKRREGRELAMQALYQFDHNSTPPQTALPPLLEFTSDHGKPLASSDEARIFAESLARGAWDHREEIDAKIARATANFRLDRIGGVERAILRLAVHEMLHSPEVPPVVAINEALEIAKKFAADDAIKFVNGVLDRIRKELPRDPRTGAPLPPVA
jgi:N utilization substance protein B